MTKLLKKAAYYIRGVFYLFLYHIPYQVLMPGDVKNRDYIKTIRVDDVSYKLKLHVADGGLPEDLHICSIREYPNVFYFKQYIERNVKRLVTYVDIGANIGYYAFLARNSIKNASGHASVFALEPVKDSYDRFRENMIVNKAGDIRALHVGIGDKDVYAQMIVMKQKNLSKIADGMIVPKGVVEKTEKIPIITMRTLFSKYAIPPKDVILRCDIEGYEYNLIVGNIQFLSQLTNAHIIMEFHPFYLGPEKSISMLRALKKAGYTLDQVVSCEILYFLRMPKIIRQLLIKLFLYQYNGEALGKVEHLRTIDDLIREVKDEHNVLYYYPNLHFYFSKQ